MASMDLGAFSVSLAVKDLAASKAFYEKLGFEMMGAAGRELVHSEKRRPCDRAVSGHV